MVFATGVSRTPNSPYGGLECVSKLKAELKRVCGRTSRVWPQDESAKKEGQMGKEPWFREWGGGGGSHVHGILRIIIFNSQ